MAGEAVVGALRVVLGLDTVDLEDGIKKAGSSLEKFAGTLNKAIPVAAIAAGFAAVTAGVLSTAESMDQLGKSAQKVGLSVEQFSALKYAADLSDISTEQLTTSLEKLSKNMSMVAGGAAGPAADAFRALGVNLKDSNGQLKSTSDVFSELADKFSGLKDSAAKTALAMAIFGKSGAELIPLLNQGREGLASAADEAKRFGLIVSEQAVKAAEEFNDNLKRLSSIMAGVMLQSTAAVSGELAGLSRTMLLIANNSGGITVAVTGLTAVLNVLLGAANLLLVALDKITANFKLFAQAAYAIATGDFSKLPALFEQYRQNLLDAGNAAVNTAKTVLGLGQSFTFAGNAIGSFNQFASKGLSDAPILKTKTAVDSFIESTNKSVVALQAQVTTFGMSAGAAAELKVMLEADQVALANHITLTQQQKDVIQDLAQDMGELTNQLQGFQTTQENLTPLEAYSAKMQELNDQLREHVINQETFQRAASKAATTAVGAYSDYFSFLATGFSAAAKKNKEFMILAKTAAIAQATINTYEAATKAMTIFPYPFNLIAAGITVAAGLAMVGKIASEGFATGGSFKVGGGRGFTDTQLVTMAAAPGEMVDVRKTGSSSAGVVSVDLGAVRDDDLFTGKRLRTLVDSLNQAHRDGYRFIFNEER